NGFVFGEASRVGEDEKNGRFFLQFTSQQVHAPGGEHGYVIAGLCSGGIVIQYHQCFIRSNEAFTDPGKETGLWGGWQFGEPFVSACVHAAQYMGNLLHCVDEHRLRQLRAAVLVELFTAYLPSTGEYTSV